MVYLLCIPCFNCLHVCSALTMSLVHKKNLISQFLKSKMADRSEMARNAIQSEFPKAAILSKNLTKNKKAILSKNSKKNKVAYRSEMATNASDLNNVRTDCWLTTTLYQYIYTYRQLCWERGNIHCVRPLGRMHTILFFMEPTDPGEVQQMITSLKPKNSAGHDNIRSKVLQFLKTSISMHVPIGYHIINKSLISGKVLKIKNLPKLYLFTKQKKKPV